MRKIKFIVLHCTSGPQDQPTDEILAYWRNVNGWTNPGYHYEISADGKVEILFPIENVANGVKGYNQESIHISYKGGINKLGKAEDNRTPAQKASQIRLIKTLKKKFPNAIVLGHRDFSTDKNGNGIIESWELIKSCPAFDVRDWLKSEGLEEIARPAGIIYKLNYPLIKDSFVAIIQKALNKAGFNLTEDSVFGEKTSNSLKAFQQKKKITVSGIADNLTISLLGIR